jgi:hypothetical protein
VVSEGGSVLLQRRRATIVDCVTRWREGLQCRHPEVRRTRAIQASDAAAYPNVVRRRQPYELVLRYVRPVKSSSLSDSPHTQVEPSVRGKQALVGSKRSRSDVR